MTSDQMRATLLEKLSDQVDYSMIADLLAEDPVSIQHELGLYARRFAEVAFPNASAPICQRLAEEVCREFVQRCLGRK